VIVEDVLQELLSDTHLQMPPYARDWVKRVLEVNVPGGKMNRGLTVVHSLPLLQSSVSQNDIFRACVLGWAIEALQAFFLVADDLMDQSVTRRGQPCWYRQDHPLSKTNDKVGLIAINDSFLLEAVIYRWLQKYFRDTPYYVDLLELFHEVTYQTELGQLLDLTSQPSSGFVDLSLFKLDTYKRIVRWKTAYYSFYMPVALAMLMAGFKDPAAFDEAKSILLPMGEYFQVQDDYLDCYGDPKVIGKVGRDIEENKCGWLICQAVLLANPAQKKLLAKHYAKEDPADVKIVKDIYRELNLENVFQRYEEQSFQELRALIQNTEHVPKGVYQGLLEKIYKRSI